MPQASAILQRSNDTKERNGLALSPQQRLCWGGSRGGGLGENMSARGGGLGENVKHAGPHSVSHSLPGHRPARRPKKRASGPDLVLFRQADRRLGRDLAAVPAVLHLSVLPRLARDRPALWPDAYQQGKYNAAEVAI